MDALSSYSDGELFARVAENDETAFREIFYRYGPILHPFALDIIKNDAIAKEIVQEVFLRVWLKRQELPGIEKPSSWLYRIASNIALTYLRRQNLEERVLKALQHQTAPAENPVMEHLSFKSLQSMVERAVQQLSPQRQRIFRLSRESGLSRKEIAKELNISENTVRNQLVICVQHIQSFIERESGTIMPVIALILGMAV